MIFSVIPLLGLYVFWRVVCPNCRGLLRWTFFILIAIGAGFPTYVDFCAGGIASPTLDLVPTLIGEGILLLLLQTAVFFLIRDGLLIASTIVRHPLKALNSKKVTLGIVVVSFFATSYGLWHSLEDPVVKEVTLQIKGLPTDLSGMRIAQLSDLHQANVFGPERLSRIVDSTNQLRADLIVITGDFVDGTVQKRGPELTALKDLQAPLGVYACEGNHEHYVDYDGWMKFLPTLGLKLLRNEHTVLSYHGQDFVLYGLTDRAAERFDREEPDEKKALSGAPEGRFIISLAHQPRHTKWVLQTPTDLMLSGHTHGGQTYLWSIVVAAFNWGYVRGLYSIERSDGGQTQMYVHSGTGFWTGFLERIGTDNEIVLFTLKGK